MTHTTLSALLSHFFTDRLCTQMDASPHTIAGYRDTFRLFLRFAGERTGRAPAKLNIEDLDAELVGDFLAMSKPSVATAPVAAIPAWPPSDPSSGSWP
jgi:integrase/recombinase XerD